MVSFMPERQTRKERIALGDQFHCSLGGKILADKTNSTQLAVQVIWRRRVSEAERRAREGV